MARVEDKDKKPSKYKDKAKSKDNDNNYDKQKLRDYAQNITDLEVLIGQLRKAGLVQSV